jgi:hypothetical protein
MDWQARSSHCKSRCGSTAHKRIKVALTFCPSISIQLRTFLKDSMAIEMFHTMRLCSELVWKRQTTIWGGTDNDTEVVVLAQLQVYYTGWYRKNCIGSLVGTWQMGSISSHRQWQSQSFIVLQHTLVSCGNVLPKRLEWLHKGLETNVVTENNLHQSLPWPVVLNVHTLSVLFVMEYWTATWMKWKKKDFSQLSNNVCGGMHSTREMGWGAHVIVNGPLRRLTYSWLREATWFMFYNLHYRIHQQSLYL